MRVAHWGTLLLEGTQVPAHPGDLIPAGEVLWGRSQAGSTRRCPPNACGAGGTPENAARGASENEDPSHPKHIPSPAPCPSLRAPLLLSSFLWFWVRGGLGAEHPPRCPAHPAPPAQHPQHRPGHRAPWYQRDFAPTTFSLFLSLSLLFLSGFYFVFFFLIPSVFFFSLPFEKNPNGNIHFHFLLSRSRDEGEGRAMKRAFFPPSLLF